MQDEAYGTMKVMPHCVDGWSGGIGGVLSAVEEKTSGFL